MGCSVCMDESRINWSRINESHVDESYTNESCVLVAVNL